LDAVNGLQIACSDGGTVRADVIYCEEGFFAGHGLAVFGVQKGDRLGTALPVPPPAASVAEAPLLQ